MQSKTTNPWIALQQVKQQFRDTENNFNDLITALMGGEDIESFDNVLVGATGQFYRFTKNASGSWTVIAQRYDDVLGQYEELVTKTFDTIDDMLDDDSDFNVASILSDLRNGMGSNQLIADLCNLYQSNPNLSLSDIDATINKSLTDEIEKSRMFEYVKSGLYEGKLSSYGWLSILERIFSKSDEDLDEGTTIMDRTSPFIIQSILSTILSLIGMVISTVALAMKSALAPLLMVVGSIISNMISWVQQYASNAVSCDPESPAYYVKGPTAYIDEIFWPGTLTTALRNSWPIGFRHWGPHDVFVWYNKDGPAPRYRLMSLNSFLTVGLDVESIIQYLFTHGDITRSSYTSGSYTYTRFTIKSMTTQKQLLYNSFYPTSTVNVYLSQDQALAILSNPSKCTKYLMMCAWLDTILNITPSSGTSFSIDTNIPWDSGVHGSYQSPFVTPSNNGAQKVIESLYLLWYYFDRTGHTFSLDDAVLPSGGDAVTELQNYYLKIVNNFATSENFFSFQSTVPTSYTYNSGTVYYHTLYGLDVTNPSYWDQVESIPTARAVTVPNVTADELVKTMAIIAIAIAAIVAAKTLTSKILAKRSTAKRLAASKQLEALRDQYLADPTSTVKYNNYYKAIRRYNLKAKILGWQSYDPVNSWYNDPDGSAASLAALANAPAQNLSNGSDTIARLATMAGVQLPGMKSDIIGNDNVDLTKVTNAVNYVRDLIQ